MKALMDDMVDALAELHEVARQMPQPKTDFTQTDETGQITISFGSHAELTSIRVKNTWKNEIDPDELLDKINQTLAVAQMRAAGLTEDNEWTIPETGPAPTSEEIRAEAEEMAEDSYQAFIDHANSTTPEQKEMGIAQGLAAIDELLAMPAETFEEKELVSSDRRVRAKVVGGMLTDIDFNPQTAGDTIKLNQALASIVQQTQPQEDN